MRSRMLALVGCVLTGFTLARAADPQAPKPGPELDKLKAYVGDWDCVMHFGTEEMKGTASCRLTCGGYWLTEVIRDDAGKFEARATAGYDPIMKKYVSTWIDSANPFMMLMVGDFDKNGKSYTETSTGPGPDGQVRKVKTVVEFKDKDNIVVKMYTLPDGPEEERLTVTYKRKK